MQNFYQKNLKNINKKMPAKHCSGLMEDCDGLIHTEVDLI